ncbi:hypothetical protein MKX03_000792 [Papaver bracteatum]|nr:hypothetical protein MKX03_000792 [Papaver bracteatum]
MERSDNRDADHIIEIERRSGTSSLGPGRHHDEEGASSSRALSIPQSSLHSSNGANSRNSLSARRSEGNVRRRRHPLKYGIWILIEVVFTLSQILASAIVSWFSIRENHQVFAWTIIYASGCLATLPFLYRRFMHRNQGTARDDTWIPGSLCFFWFWLSVGYLWLFLFGKHYPSAEAPSLYMFSTLFLMLCCIVLPWICCCCLPCVMSILGSHENLNQARGSTTETTNVHDTNAQGVGEGGGTLAAGTEEARIISWKDAVCSICLGKYADNEELKELPCAHFFHVDCVDEWLKKNDSCPLCKRGIRENGGYFQTSAVVHSSL